MVLFGWQGSGGLGAANVLVMFASIFLDFCLILK
jgi:hypothetical protein